MPRATCFADLVQGQFVTSVYKNGDFVQTRVVPIRKVTKVYIELVGGGCYSRKTGHSLGPRAADNSESHIELL